MTESSSILGDREYVVGITRLQAGAFLDVAEFAIAPVQLGNQPQDRLGPVDRPTVIEEASSDLCDGVISLGEVATSITGVKRLLLAWAPLEKV